MKRDLSDTARNRIMPLFKADPRIECGPEVGTRDEIAMPAGKPMLNERLRAPRLSDRSLKFQKLRFHQARP
jgi:hypothetical protein